MRPFKYFHWKEKNKKHGFHQITNDIETLKSLNVYIEWCSHENYERSARRPLYGTIKAKKASCSLPQGGAAHHCFLHQGQKFFSYIWLLFFILSSQTIIPSRVEEKNTTIGKWHTDWRLEAGGNSASFNTRRKMQEENRWCKCGGKQDRMDDTWMKHRKWHWMCQ